MRFFAALAVATCLIDSVASIAWLSTSRAKKRNHGSPSSRGFITTKNGKFLLNDKPFFFIGTNVYWLQQVSDDNIDLVMKTIASKNISVVRTWAFNDVFDIPATGAWFQAFNPNGTTTINTGANGLQRLDKILDAAKANNLKVILSLTNNWNPPRPSQQTLLNRDTTPDNVTHPPGFLSNDYGGMDVYVRAHGQTHHDTFFANETIIKAFQNYLNVVIPRYMNRTELFAWELANDARCNSTQPQSSNCIAQTVTRWHARLSQTVKQIDPNHVVAAGTGGFFCTGCPKLFPLHHPSPSTSPAPGQTKRAMGPLTTKKLLERRRAQVKRNEDAIKKRWASAAEQRSQGLKPRWSYRGQKREGPYAKRQSSATGTAFDGSVGVDAEDILNIPEIGFSTFQLFPDQNVYEPLDQTLNSFNNTVQSGADWIKQQAETGTTFNKPVVLTAFGLVTEDNFPELVFFNSSQPFLPLTANTTQQTLPTPTGLGVGIDQGQLPLTDQQQQIAYSVWIETAIENAMSGLVQWQWSQQILPSIPPSSSTQQQTTFVPSVTQQVTPNDGYSGGDSVQNVLQNGATQQQQILGG